MNLPSVDHCGSVSAAFDFSVRSRWFAPLASITQTSVLPPRLLVKAILPLTPGNALEAGPAPAKTMPSAPTVTAERTAERGRIATSFRRDLCGTYEAAVKE